MAQVYRAEVADVDGTHGCVGVRLTLRAKIFEFPGSRKGYGMCVCVCVCVRLCGSGGGGSGGGVVIEDNSPTMPHVLYITLYMTS